MVQIDKRESLIRSAASLFHRRGFEHTSLADIAADAGVPLGNVYYYFKTRGDLLKAVSERRLEMLRGRRAELESLASPRERLLTYMDGWESHTDELTAHGCPVGGLCLETNKQGGEAADNAASVLQDMLEWFVAQFRAMGYREKDARELAAKLVGARHGSILLANTFKDPGFIRQETARLKKWVEELPDPKRRKKS